MIFAFVTLVFGAVLLLEHSAGAEARAAVFVPLAMQAQNAALRPGGGAKLGTTYVTGALFNVGRDIAGALLHTAPQWRWLQHLVVWSALLADAVARAALHAHIGVPALFLPLALYAGLTTASALATMWRATRS